jgi:formylmethanofuran dehydrogenase subunit C
MSALTFNLKKPLQFAINCAALTPDGLANRTLNEIAALTLHHGKQAVRVDELFDISGHDSASLRFLNATQQLDCLGANMRSGRIDISGDAGAYLGFAMKGGEIHCLGNTQDLAACNMQNGLMVIHGNTGDFLGGAAAGLRKGMLGGTVVVKGHAGDRVGDQMRRGLILIEGNAGDYCASRMLAGTIGVLGKVGAYAGFSMHRGTLMLRTQPDLHPTMQACGSHTLPFLNLLYKSFAPYSQAFASLNTLRAARWLGDAANKGNGEILIINHF